LTTNAAIALLDLVLTLRQDRIGRTSGSIGNDVGAAELLEERCWNVLRQDWQNVCQRDDGSAIWKRLLEQWMEAGDTYRERLLNWFPETLQQANAKLTQSQDELKESWERQANLREELEEARVQAKSFQHEAEHLRKTLKSTKTELKGQLSGWMEKRSRDLVAHRANEDHLNQ
jgi:uncharacterized protein YukE